MGCTDQLHRWEDDASNFASSAATGSAAAIQERSQTEMHPCTLVLSVRKAAAVKLCSYCRAEPQVRTVICNWETLTDLLSLLLDP